MPSNASLSTLAAIHAAKILKSTEPGQARAASLTPASRLALGEPVFLFSPAFPDLKAEVQRYECDLIRLALACCDGNQTAAAKLLGLPRRTFVYKLRLLRKTELQLSRRVEAPDNPFLGHPEAV